MTALPAPQMGHHGDCRCPACVPYVRHGEPRLSRKDDGLLGMAYPCGRLVGESDAKAEHRRAWPHHKDRITCRACVLKLELRITVELDREEDGCDDYLVQGNVIDNPDGDLVTLVTMVTNKRTYIKSDISEFPNVEREKIEAALFDEAERLVAA